jgi:hypothetical protein
VEVPAVEALLLRFQAAHTQVLGVSVDSVYSHANWGKDLGGISFPLLADFEPKGAVGKAYGLYLDGPGITDRATVIIDSSGVVRYAVSVTPQGQRDIEALAGECEKIDRAASGKTAEFGKPPGVPAGTVLYVKSQCGFSRAALLARENLHLEDRVPVKNVSEDPKAAGELEQIAGKGQAPCLVVDGKPMHESADIIRRLVGCATPG